LSAAGAEDIREIRVEVAKPHRRTEPPPPEAPPPDPTYWPLPVRNARPLTPTPGHDNYSLRGKALKVIGVSVCGFTRTDLERIVDMIERHQRQIQNFIPVFLTDTINTDIFRNRGYVFEYLPPPSRVPLRGARAWHEYASARRRLLAQKWGMTDIITFGTEAFGRPASAPDSEKEAATAGSTHSPRRTSDLRHRRHTR